MARASHCSEFHFDSAIRFRFPGKGGSAIETIPKVLFIVGCTGCGKGGLGREIARRVGGEIVSLDSMKVYRRMDIGTAKPSSETRASIPHHLIDLIEPSEEFTVMRYLELAERALADIAARGRPALVVGGTFLYLKAMTSGMFDGPGADPAIRDRLNNEAQTQGKEALHDRLRGVDPVAAERIHVNDLRRVIRALEVFELTGKPISEHQQQWAASAPDRGYQILGLRREAEDQSHRTNERVRRMIDAGLVEEVRRLLGEEKPLSTTARKAVGYAEIIEHLQDRATLADAIEMIKINTRQFAKAQRTWMKRFESSPQSGIASDWIELDKDATAKQVADDLMSKARLPWSA